MKVSVEMDSTTKILNDLGLNQKGKVHLFATNESTKRMDKYIPMDSGDLKNTSVVKVGETTYTMPYAQKQYYENKGSGIRGSYWDKRMTSAEINQLVKDVQKYMEGL